MKRSLLSGLGLALAAATLPAVLAAPAKGPVGYTDTDYLPGQRWRVHDAHRPRPAEVAPAPSKTLGMPAPTGATVLFDGKDLSQWTAGKGKNNPEGKPAWKVENGYVEVTNTGSISTKEAFGDMYLHLEFATPTQIVGESQGRGNSGVIIMGKYEVQVLDSYDNPTYADGQCAAIYGQFPPLVNASLKPGEWQTYDIYFQAPRWDDKGKFLSPAISTVYHNGVLVQDKQAHIGQVSHRRVGAYFQAHGKAPLSLQEHGNPMRFRNIWIAPLPDDKRVDPAKANGIRPEDLFPMKEIMVKGHKEGLLKKVVEGQADKGEKALLLAMHRSLPLHRPGKGDPAAWATLTAELVAATEAAAQGKPDATKRLGELSNCKACHTQFKKD